MSVQVPAVGGSDRAHRGCGERSGPQLVNSPYQSFLSKFECPKLGPQFNLRSSSSSIRPLRALSSHLLLLLSCLPGLWLKTRYALSAEPLAQVVPVRVRVR